MAPIICCIDGNIGAGKSTVLNVLSEKGYAVFQEDLSDWIWCLERYYSDQDRWAFTLQMAILKSMSSQYKKINTMPNDVVFIERSPISSMIFTKTIFKAGNLTEQELALVQEFNELVGWKPDLTFKLDTCAEKCLERIKSRNRPCEQNITLDYLNLLEQEYNQLDSVSISTDLGPEDTCKIIMYLITNFYTYR